MTATEEIEILVAALQKSRINRGWILSVCHGKPGIMRFMTELNRVVLESLGTCGHLSNRQDGLDAAKSRSICTCPTKMEAAKYLTEAGFK